MFFLIENKLVFISNAVSHRLAYQKSEVAFDFWECTNTSRFYLKEVCCTLRFLWFRWFQAGKSSSDQGFFCFYLHIGRGVSSLSLLHNRACNLLGCCRWSSDILINYQRPQNNQRWSPLTVPCKVQRAPNKRWKSTELLLFNTTNHQSSQEHTVWGEGP